MTGISAFSGEKAAGGITRSSAMELAHEGIRVNAIDPGVFDTQMFREAMGREAISHGCQAVPMGQFGEAAELIDPVIFLLSDESSYMTGAQLFADRGWTV